MLLFEKPGKENTESCIAIAVQKAAERNAPIVIASYTGYAAQSLLQQMNRIGLTAPVVVVRGVFGMHEEGKFRMSCDTEQTLLNAGVRIVSAAHALSGCERGLSRKFQGVYPVEIIAHTLRMLGQGTKVCVECATMALDAGLLEYGRPVISIGGTGGGSDTCLLITPAVSPEILQTKIHEIYCKPHL